MMREAKNIDILNPPVAGILADHGLPPEVLMLEVIEGVIMNEHSVAIETMNTLRKLGAGTCIAGRTAIPRGIGC
jgi:EAL domain-containing protein (putative c-di-GMP-specific phosphodiesterase class I)